MGSLGDAAPPWAAEGESQGRGSRACLRLGGLGPPGSLVLQMAPRCLPDHRPVLPGASLPSLVWPACTTQRLGLPPSVSLRSLAGVPWPRAQLQPGNHRPPSVALCLNDEPVGEGRVRTSESTRSGPRPLWAEKLRHRETKGSPAAGLTKSCGLPCRLSLRSPGALVHAVWVLEWAGAPRGSRGPILILPRSLPAQQTRGWWVARRRAWGQLPTFPGGQRLCWWLYLTGLLIPTVPHSLAPRGVQHMRAHNAGEQLTAPRASVCCVCGPGQRPQQSHAQPSGVAVEDSTRRGAGDSRDLRLGPAETVLEKPP